MKKRTEDETEEETKTTKEPKGRVEIGGGGSPG